jgi:hypothetical protein
MSESLPPSQELAAFVRDVELRLPTLEVPQNRPQRLDFLMLYGFCTQAARFSSAAMLQVDAGYSREASASVRCALEHAITAHWCLFTREGMPRLMIEMRRGFTGYLASMGEYLQDEEVLALVAEQPTSEGKGLPRFSDMMFDLDEHRFLRQHYAMYSHAVHPTSITVTAYRDEDGDITHLRSVPRESNEQGVSYVAAVASMLALSALEHTIDPWLAPSNVEEDGERLRLPAYLQHAIPSNKRRVFFMPGAVASA